jgi:hypothetical protein
VKTPKECKDIEQLIEVEMNLRAKLIIQLAKLQATTTVVQRAIELLSSNPTEELLEEMRRQVADFNSAWQDREKEVVAFLEVIKEIIEMRKELTPRYQPIFIPGGGMPGLGGMNPQL